jgi:hypothetical protein
MMMERREVVIAQRVRELGALSLAKVFKVLFFWWPILPLGVFATWTCRRERWFGSIGVWGAVLVAGHIAGVFETHFAVPRYLAPLEMGFFFPVSVAVITLMQRYSKRGPLDAGG